MPGCSAQLGTAALRSRVTVTSDGHVLKLPPPSQAPSGAPSLSLGFQTAPQQWVRIPKGSLSTPWFLWGSRWEENVQLPQHQGQFWPPWLQKKPRGCWVITPTCRMTQGEVQAHSRSLEKPHLYQFWAIALLGSCSCFC